MLDITHTAHPPRFPFSQFHTKSCTFSRTCQNSPILKDTLVRYDPHGSSTSIPFFAISSKMLYFSNLTRIRQFWDVRLLDMIHTAHPPRFPLQQFPAKCLYFFPVSQKLANSGLNIPTRHVQLDSLLRNFRQSVVLFPNLNRVRQFWVVRLLDMTHTAHPPGLEFPCLHLHTKSCTFP